MDVVAPKLNFPDLTGEEHSLVEQDWPYMDGTPGETREFRGELLSYSMPVLRTVDPIDWASPGVWKDSEGKAVRADTDPYDVDRRVVVYFILDGIPVMSVGRDPENIPGTVVTEDAWIQAAERPLPAPVAAASKAKKTKTKKVS